jgi:hypothetical protein
LAAASAKIIGGGVPSLSTNNTKGAFPPSHFCNKLDDKLALKVALVSFVENQFGL